LDLRICGRRGSREGGGTHALEGELVHSEVKWLEESEAEEEQGREKPLRVQGEW
jgi:hypothetical protein